MQASPKPSPLLSSWAGFECTGQLSASSTTASLSSSNAGAGHRLHDHCAVQVSFVYRTGPDDRRSVIHNYGHSAEMFFGPSFAVAQSLATVRMRAISTSIILFVESLIGLGLGPAVAGAISDHLEPTVGTPSLSYGLVIVGLCNIGAAVHYLLGARSYREDLAVTGSLNRGDT
jgi:hypothetical protein